MFPNNNNKKQQLMQVLVYSMEVISILIASLPLSTHMA